MGIGSIGKPIFKEELNSSAGSHRLPAFFYARHSQHAFSLMMQGKEKALQKEIPIH